VQCAGLEFVFRVANSGEMSTEVQGFMATFATRRIAYHWYTSRLTKRLNLADEFVSSHSTIVGQKRPFYKNNQLKPLREALKSKDRIPEEMRPPNAR